MQLARNFFFLFTALCLPVLQTYAQTGPKGAVSLRDGIIVLPENFVRVMLKPGEDEVALLKRYNLSDYECDMTKFIKINNLPINFKLKEMGYYKIPVSVVTYDGKSIRTTLKTENWSVAKHIAQFNRDAKEQGLRDDDFVFSKILWVPWHAFNCPDASVPAPKVVEKSKRPPVPDNLLAEPSSGKGGRNFPIFGKKYERTPLQDRKLAGRVFYIVSGHGGPDVGAQGKRADHILCEDEYAYDVSLRLLRLLISHGATAYMIVRDQNDGIRDSDLLQCDKDEIVWGNRVIPLPQKERLQQRTDLINTLTEKYLKAGITDQTMIEIHVDSRSSDNKTDVFFYFRPESEISRTLALRFHRTFQQKYSQIRGQRGYGGTVSPRYLYMLKETSVPRAVYIELGNIRNDWDQQRLVLKNNRQAVANWLLEALITE